MAQPRRSAPSGSAEDPVQGQVATHPDQQQRRSLRPSHTVFNMETFVSGTYNKFNDYSGVTIDHLLALEFDSFSHWTFAKTVAQLMVTDLTSVTTEGNVTLSDPTIHSSTRLLHRYGKTNLG